MDWDKLYREAGRVWSESPDLLLAQYAPLIPKGRILDLGMGEGRNLIYFAKHGFEAIGVDISPTAVDRFLDKAKSMQIAAQAQTADIRSFDIEPDGFVLIISTMTLQFIKKSESEALIQRIKQGLQSDGMVYLTMFSTEEPAYARETRTEIEPNTFSSDDGQRIVHYFERDEILSAFADFKLLHLAQIIEYDAGHPGAPEPHYHGIVTYLGQKA